MKSKLAFITRVLDVISDSFVGVLKSSCADINLYFYSFSSGRQQPARS